MISSVRTLALHLRNAKPTCVRISPAKPLPATSCVHTDNCLFFFVLAKCGRAVHPKCPGGGEQLTAANCAAHLDKNFSLGWQKLKKKKKELSIDAISFSCSQMHLETRSSLSSAPANACLHYITLVFTLSHSGEFTFTLILNCLMLSNVKSRVAGTSKCNHFALHSTLTQTGRCQCWPWRRTDPRYHCP